MKPVSKFLFAILIVVACMGQTQPLAQQMQAEIIKDTLLQKTDSLLNVVRDLKQNVPKIEQQQQKTIVKLNAFNYRLNRFIVSFRHEKKNNDDVVITYVPPPEIVVIREESQRVYGSTPAREQTEREKNEGKAFKGVGNLFKKIFKRKE